MKKLYLAFALFIVFSFVLSACGGGAATPEATVNSKLDEVMNRGILIISTDPAYPPQSELVEGGSRAAETQCAGDQHTASELTGFDVETAVAIAEKMGLEPCFVTPDWTLITGGSWSDRWDISIGSMTITPGRMENLYFTQPYYTTPAAFFVHQDNTSFSQPSDLSGQTIGACTGCTYDFYLDKSLEIPGEDINFVVDNPEFMGYETDLNALQDLALGDGVRLDAVMTAQPTGQGAIDDGLPLKQLGDPVYFEYLAGAIDKQHSTDPAPLVEKVSEVINELHQDGTLLALSQKYYGLDLTSAAADFDWSQLNQFE